MKRAEFGFTTLQYVVAVAFSLVLFVMVANLLVDLYARGAVRDALDEGVRAAVPTAATPAACEARAREVLESIAGGSVVEVNALRCEQVAGRVVASAEVSLQSWLPMLVPDWNLDLQAAAEREE